MSKIKKVMIQIKPDILQIKETFHDDEDFIKQAYEVTQKRDREK